MAMNALPLDECRQQFLAQLAPLPFQLQEVLVALLSLDLLPKTFWRNSHQVLSFVLAGQTFDFLVTWNR